MAALPGLKELIKNPFILRLTVESLPWLEKFLKERQRISSISEEEEQIITLKKEEIVLINQYAIYKCFMEHWFTKQELKLEQSNEKLHNLNVKAMFADLSREIALKLYAKNKAEIRVREDPQWKLYFEDHNREIVIARNGCPLRKIGDDRYAFIHKSFLEYFIADGILETITNKNIHLQTKARLSPEMIIQDQEVVSFFKYAFDLDSKIQKECFFRINESILFESFDISSEKSAVADIAAKAITLLVHSFENEVFTV